MMPLSAPLFGLQLAEGFMADVHILISLYTHLLKHIFLLLIHILADVTPASQQPTKTEHAADMLADAAQRCSLSVQYCQL